MPKDVPPGFSARPDVTVTLPYWVANALFTAALVGKDHDHERTPATEDPALLDSGLLALGRALQEARSRYQ